jgi:hypothetical protein
MSYYESQTLDCQGIPTVEFRVNPEIPQKILIEFTPQFPFDDYAYDDPKFVFGTEVIIAKQWLSCQENLLDFLERYEVYRVAALDLIEISLTGNRLYEPPHWRYGIRGFNGESLTWFEESDLIALSEIQSDGEF